jgi:hypothetical protein
MLNYNKEVLNIIKKYPFGFTTFLSTSKSIDAVELLMRLHLFVAVIAVRVFDDSPLGSCSATELGLSYYGSLT